MLYSQEPNHEKFPTFHESDAWNFQLRLYEFCFNFKPKFQDNVGQVTLKKIIDCACDNLVLCDPFCGFDPFFSVLRMVL